MYTELDPICDKMVMGMYRYAPYRFRICTDRWLKKRKNYCIYTCSDTPPIITDAEAAVGVLAHRLGREGVPRY
jgi:hypothetical protein